MIFTAELKSSFAISRKATNKQKIQNVAAHSMCMLYHIFTC